MSKTENLYPVVLNSAFGTNVAFLPNPRPTERTVVFKDCIWTQGYSPEWLDKPLVKSFGTSHARLIFGLFKFFQDHGLTEQTSINVGFSGLTKILQLGQGGQSVKEIQRLLGELASIWSKVVYPDGSVEEFKILDFTTRRTKNGEEKLKTVCFSDGFITLLNHFDPDKIYTLLYSVLCNMSSNVAQAIYLQFTHKVVRETTNPFTENNPWRKNITNLLQDLDQVVPKYRSQRKQIFTRVQGNKGSVIEQLDGVPIQQPHIILHAKLEENAAKDDYNLCLWCERIKEKAPTEKGEGAMLQWWLMSGRSEDEYRQRLKAYRPICPKVKEDLADCGYPVKQNLRFLEIANKLLNDGELEELASDCKYRVNAEKSIANIGAYLHASIKNGIIEQSINERVLGIEEEDAE